VLLEIKNLNAYYHTTDGVVKAVDSISFPVKNGETVGLVGESGCGKSTVALSILGLLPPGGSIHSGEIRFKGRNLVRMNDAQIREIRGKKISIAFQGAMNALNPVKTIRDQIVESILLHDQIGKAQAQQKAAELFTQVGIAPHRLGEYPHQLSGGMKQRAMIAMALSSDPELLIADEPVTALDVMVQAQILELIKTLRRTLNLSILMITHDLSVVAETCDFVVVMYAGKIVEYVKMGAQFLHPYTRRLFRAFPNIRAPKEFVQGIPGSPPDLINPPPGCRFFPRCDVGMQRCEYETPATSQVSEDHSVACHLLGEQR
jgi:peptide/nickel transport system ATP-binding protein